MTKYEIMMIIDPKQSSDKYRPFILELFKNKPSKFDKLEQTTLAYRIRNSLNGSYYLILIEADADEIKEFVRKVNLQKYIWRYLIINLDSERGINRPFKKKPKFKKWEGEGRSERSGEKRDYSKKPQERRDFSKQSNYRKDYTKPNKPFNSDSNE